MAILEAEVAFLAHALGYTPEQVRAGAVQRIQAQDWVVSRQHTSSVQGIPSAQWGTEAGQPSKAAAAQGVKAGEGGVDEDLETATYTMVTIEKATGKWGAKILLWDGDKRRQHWLGAYTTPKEAAVAFVAAAHVLRHGEEIVNTIPLIDAHKALLEGCDKDAVVKLVGARMWWRWKKWRQVVQELDSKKRRQRKAPSANTRGKKRRVDGKVAGGGDVEATGSDVAGIGQTEPIELVENEGESQGASGKEDDGGEDENEEGDEGYEGDEGDEEYVGEEGGDEDGSQ
ncbi:unnamed protein product [Closterium sp. NIES-65]|nr:unnamed protein product [Closterium sp. NIES-65]